MKKDPAFRGFRPSATTDEKQAPPDRDEFGLSEAERQAIVGLWRAGHSASHLSELYGLALDVVRHVVRTTKPIFRARKTD